VTAIGNHTIDGVNVAAFNRIRWKCQYQDSRNGSGVYYIGGRYYSPLIRQFLSPAGPESAMANAGVLYGINQYLICLTNTINMEYAGYTISVALGGEFKTGAMVGGMVGTLVALAFMPKVMAVKASFKASSAKSDLANGVQKSVKQLTPISELNHTNKRIMKNIDFADLVADAKSGNIRETIKIIDINGSKYILDGNHRVFAMRKAGIQSALTETVSLPHKGFHTVEDVLWANAEFLGLWR